MVAASGLGAGWGGVGLGWVGWVDEAFILRSTPSIIMIFFSLIKIGRDASSFASVVICLRLNNY